MLLGSVAGPQLAASLLKKSQCNVGLYCSPYFQGLSLIRAVLIPNERGYDLELIS